MIPVEFRNNNLTTITDDFTTLKDSAAPLFHLLQSTSFIESIKIAIPQLITDVCRKNWKVMNGKERFNFICSNISAIISRRFDYLILLTKSTLDFVVSTIKAIFSTIFRIFSSEQYPKKHWRHLGVALFTIFNSCFGIITPKYANLSQLFFSVTVLGITGRNVKDKINNLILEVQNRWQQAHQQVIHP